jgi:hypothetical protein
MDVNHEVGKCPKEWDMAQVGKCTKEWDMATHANNEAPILLLRK